MKIIGLFQFAIVGITFLITSCGTSPVKNNLSKEEQCARSSGWVSYGTYECFDGKFIDKTRACPGLANPQCLTNWDAIELGLSEDDVTIFLGQPTSVSSSSYNRTWNYRTTSYHNGNVTIKDGKVDAFRKPDLRGLFFHSPIEGLTTPTTVTNLVSSCPGLGNSECKVNWTFIKQGMSKNQIETVLGSPDSIKNVKLNKADVLFDETWIYKPDAEIRLYNGTVVGYDKPGSYKYHGGVEE